MKHYFLLFCFLLLPSISSADVVINEVAWMGTMAGPNEEWIELYNNGTDVVNLEGWTVQDSTSLRITLTGTIGAGEFVVLERTDDETLPGIPALVTYTGALSNGGGTLTLFRGDGSVENQVVGGSNWENIGGDNITKATAQRTGTGWITGTSTPRAQNSITATTEDTVDDVDTQETATVTTSSSHTIQKSGSGASAKKVVPRAPGVLSLTMEAPRILYVNQEINFIVYPEGVGDTIKKSLKYTWNFGDTYTGEGKKPTHVFTYPGDYIVAVEGSFAKQKAEARMEVKVLPVQLTLTRTGQGNIEIKNNSKQEFDLSGFTIQGIENFIFPKMSFLKAGGVLTISAVRIGGSIEKNIALYDTTETLVATLEAIAPLEETAVLKSLVLKKVSIAANPEINATLKSVKKSTEELVGTASPKVHDEITYIPIGTQSNAESNSSGFLKKAFSILFGLWER